LLKGHPDAVEALAFSPNGKSLAAGCGSTAIVWDVSTGTIHRIVRTPTEGNNRVGNVPREAITALAFSPDSSVLAIGRDAQENWMHFAILTGNEKEIRPHVSKRFSSAYHEGPAMTKAVAYDARAKLVAVVGQNPADVRNRGGFNAIALVNPITNAKEDGDKLSDHEAALECVQFSPDGSTLAAGTADKLVIIYDTAKRIVKTKLKGHGGAVRTLAFSMDGKLLASAGNDKSVRVWDMEQGKLLATLDGHGHSVLQVQFSKQGDALTSVDALGVVKVWQRQATQR
jgi:WD40 repeat protein